jgi:hypothetical protein
MRVARFAPVALYPEGTMSRVDAVLLFTGFCKTREMQSLQRERLASALHIEKVSRKSKSRNLPRKATKYMTKESRIEKICARASCHILLAAPSETAPTTSSSSRNPQTN